MKILNVCNHLLSVALKHSALAFAVGATVILGAGQSAHANLNYTFANLGGDAADNVEGWTAVFPGNYTPANSANAVMWANYNGSWTPTTPVDDGHLGDGWDAIETQLAHSPAFKLNGSGNMTWQMFGTPSPASAPTSLNSAGIGSAALPGTGFMGVALRDVATDTYVLWSAWPGSTFTPAAFTSMSFTAAQLAPYANNGRAYTLDFIDNDKSPNGDNHWVTLGGASIPGNVISTIKTYNFNDGSLQGWHNRVWNASTSAWVDLAPDLETMPGTVNGGVIQPPSVDNNLLANNGTKIEAIGGDINNHLNSQWLRSPVFKLGQHADMTAKIGGGEPTGAAPADEASVPFAADANGWKGIALRTVSDGVFVLAKASSSIDTTVQTVTFTAAELAQYAGLDCTLELINLGKGTPGWVTMDDVSVPVPPSNARDMLTFGSEYGTGGVISGTNVNLFVPLGTNLATLAPSSTVSPFASYAGPTPNFSVANPSTYVVTAQDGTTKNYTVTISFGTASTACDILAFAFPGEADTVISGTNINVTVPVTTDVTALAPTYTTSAFATGAPASSTLRNFTSPQSYTITAQNGSTTKTYLVTVTKGAVPSIFTWNTTLAGNWSESAKWTNDLATGTKPTNSGQPYYTLNFTQAGTYTTTHDLNNGFVLNQLNLAGAVTLAGTNSLALTANGATLPTINQNSASGAVIVSPVNLAANLTVAGSGNGQVSLSGLVAGTGQLIKNSSGGLQLRGHTVQNTYSGGTIVNSGMLQLGYYDGVTTFISNDPMGSGPVTLSSGATITFDRVTASNALTVNGGTLANYNGWPSAWTGPITLNATLTTDAPNPLSCNGVISGTGGIVKTSGGSLHLSGINTYSGDTTVNGGTLFVNGTAIKDTTKLVIGGGKVAATGTEIVNTLFFGATQQAAGTWGATGSGATNIDDVHFSATIVNSAVVANGVVSVLTGSANDYATWGSSYLPTDVSVPTADSDGDGMSNFQEYAFGLNPTSASSVSPITAPLSKATGMFSYTRRATPATSGLTYSVLTSTNLLTWTPDAGAVAESVATVGNVQTVTITVSNPAVNGQLFVRVKASQ